MAISEEQVRHVALLARLSLTDEQVASYREDLNSILDHIDTIQQLDLEDVEPTAHALDVVNEMRADESPCLSSARARAQECARGHRGCLRDSAHRRRGDEA
jgi:aspartyl-tRNA(Asn)/glutamyl-tRNA(Gln) amidotransferase subunit C